MAWFDPFLLGPLDAMRPLPSPPHGGEVKVTPSRTGGLHEPLMGPAVQDVWRVRREWEFSWPESHTAVVETIRRQWYLMDRRPRRLLDPMAGANLLAIDTATVGAVSRTLARFDVGSRPVTFQAIRDVPDELDGVTGGLHWAVPAGVGDALRADVTRPVPVLGRDLTVSQYVRGAGTVAAQVEPLDATGAALGPIRGPQTPLTATAWTRVAVTLPAGSPALSALPALAVFTGDARTVESVGWQAEHADTPGPWDSAGACPLVTLAGDHDYSYLRLNRRKVSLTLQEV